MSLSQIWSAGNIQSHQQNFIFLIFALFLQIWVIFTKARLKNDQKLWRKYKKVEFFIFVLEGDRVE